MFAHNTQLIFLLLLSLGHFCVRLLKYILSITSVTKFCNIQTRQFRSLLTLLTSVLQSTVKGFWGDGAGMACDASFRSSQKDFLMEVTIELDRRGAMSKYGANTKIGNFCPQIQRTLFDKFSNPPFLFKGLLHWANFRDKFQRH